MTQEFVDKLTVASRVVVRRVAPHCIICILGRSIRGWIMRDGIVGTRLCHHIVSYGVCLVATLRLTTSGRGLRLWTTSRASTALVLGPLSISSSRERVVRRKVRRTPILRWF